MNNIPDTALSVGGLTLYIKELLEGDRHLVKLWVTGEVSSSKDHSSGLFFTLSDPEGNASIKCVVWRSRRDPLRGAQRQKLVAQPKVGEQLLVLGSIRVYPKRGEYQLNVWQAIPAGEGLQALRYQQLRGRLEAEGLFDAQRKRPLPLHPQTIAVVTSPEAAAWGDIQRTLQQRYPGLHVLFSPATVQGEQAPASIAIAIDRVNRDSRAEVLILARGGGAAEDLSCFNDERVVRAIASSSIPVITGIGHQRDESLADLVADFSTHTPTAAAEQVVPALAGLVAEHQQRENKLIETVRGRLARETDHLELLKSRLKAIPSTSRSLQQATAKCQLLKQQLVALDPLAVLQRGYAVVKREDNTVVRSTANLVPQQELKIQLGQGIVVVKITKIIEQESC